MEKIKRNWKRIPGTVRKPFVLIVGLLFIIAAGLTGWLPGPGGIPLFLIGIAILATEFAWAKRVRDEVLKIIERGSRLFRKHKIIGTIILLLLATVVVIVSVAVWRKLQ